LRSGVWGMQQLRGIIGWLRDSNGTHPPPGPPTPAPKPKPTPTPTQPAPPQGKSLVMSPILASTNVILPAVAAGAKSKRVSLSLLARDDELPPAGDKGAPSEPKYSVSAVVLGRRRPNLGVFGGQGLNRFVFDASLHERRPT